MRDMLDMLDVARQRGVRVAWDDLGDRHGEFDGQRTIALNNRRPEEVQRIVLAHELGHHHHGHQVTDDARLRARQEAEADRHAAVLLVDRWTHEHAERVYGPSEGAVAAELGVPTRFVTALREVARRDLWPHWCGNCRRDQLA